MFDDFNTLMRYVPMLNASVAALDWVRANGEFPALLSVASTRPDRCGPLWWTQLPRGTVMHPLRPIRAEDLAQAVERCPGAMPPPPEEGDPLVYVWTAGCGEVGPQQMMLDYCAAAPEPHGMLGFDLVWDDGGHPVKGYCAFPWTPAGRRYMWERVIARLPERSCNFYHLQKHDTPSPFHVDVDVDLSVAVNVAAGWGDAAHDEALLRELVCDVVAPALRGLGASGDASLEVHGLQASRAGNKVSWHLWWPRVVFPDQHTQMTAFVHSVLLVDRHTARDPRFAAVTPSGRTVPIIDPTIYSKNRLFRLFRSCKRVPPEKAPRPLVRMASAVVRPAPADDCECFFASFLLPAADCERVTFCPAPALPLLLASGTVTREMAERLHAFFTGEYPLERLEALLHGGFDGRRVLCVRSVDTQTLAPHCERWLWPVGVHGVRAALAAVRSRGRLVTALDFGQRHAIGGDHRSPVVFAEVCVDLDADSLARPRACGGCTEPRQLCEVCMQRQMLPLARAVDAALCALDTAPRSRVRWFATGGRGLHGVLGGAPSPLTTEVAPYPEGRRFIAEYITRAVAPLALGSIDRSVTVDAHHTLRAPWGMHDRTGRVGTEISLDT